MKSRTECCTWVSTENRECADGKESDNENGSRGGDGASDDEEVALLQRSCLRLLSLAYHALSVGSLLQLSRRRFWPPSSESTQSTEVFRAIVDCLTVFFWVFTPRGKYIPMFQTKVRLRLHNNRICPPANSSLLDPQTSVFRNALLLTQY